MLKRGWDNLVTMMRQPQLPFDSSPSTGPGQSVLKPFNTATTLTQPNPVRYNTPNQLTKPDPKLPPIPFPTFDVMILGPRRPIFLFCPISSFSFDIGRTDGWMDKLGSRPLSSSFLLFSGFGRWGGNYILTDARRRPRGKGEKIFCFFLSFCVLRT